MSEHNMSSFQKNIKLCFLVTVALISGYIKLLRYYPPMAAFIIVAAITLLPLIIWGYTRLVIKMAATTRAQQKSGAKFIFEKVPMRAFLTGNLGNLVGLCALFALAAILLIFKVGTADKSLNDQLSLLLSIVIPLCSGYAGAYIANRSEILNGALATLLLIVSNLFMPGDSGPLFSSPVFDHIVDWSPPFLGALGGYLRFLYVSRTDATEDF